MGLIRKKRRGRADRLFDEEDQTFFVIDEYLIESDKTRYTTVKTGTDGNPLLFVAAIEKTPLPDNEIYDRIFLPCKAAIMVEMNLRRIKA